MVFWADADAPAFAGPIKLTATGGDEAKPVRREVRPYTRVESTQNLGSSRPTRELIVGVVTEPAPFALAFENDQSRCEAGKKVELKLKCERPGPDFKGAVTVIELARPGPIRMNQRRCPRVRTR